MKLLTLTITFAVGMALGIAMQSEPKTYPHHSIMVLHRDPIDRDVSWFECQGAQ